MSIVIMFDYFDAYNCEIGFDIDAKLLEKDVIAAH